MIGRPSTTASVSPGTAITHSFVAFSPVKLKSPVDTMHAIIGGVNSTIICQDMVMTFRRPLWLVVSRTTGPGSMSW